ncbi:hypothetical protein M5K25_026029 [Dendrobium thyrsiflorum]|uniref:DUF4283 domain-containing protein n=1 Tax=Dendrobium thyrsiflorum TaxID=117978 RepID=A0ABD0TWF0_DENTH
MRLLKWTPNFDVREESPIAPVWILFPNLRLHFFNNLVLFSLASIFGRPLQTDQASSNISRPSVTRVLVELYVSKKHLKEVWFGSELNGYFQKVEFKNFPRFCAHCKMHGHAMSECYILHPYLRKQKESNKNSEGDKPVLSDPETFSNYKEGKCGEPQPLEITHNVSNEVGNVNAVAMVVTFVKEREVVDEQMLAIMKPNGLNINSLHLVSKVDNVQCINLDPISSLMNVQDNASEGIMEEGEFISSPHQDDDVPVVNDIEPYPYGKGLSGMEKSICRQNIEELANSDDGALVALLLILGGEESLSHP